MSFPRRREKLGGEDRTPCVSPRPLSPQILPSLHRWAFAPRKQHASRMEGEKQMRRAAAFIAGVVLTASAGYGQWTGPWDHTWDFNSGPQGWTLVQQNPGAANWLS